MAGTTASGQPLVKLGLALSGGGLRAAYFHIGVLAQLARLGLLRRVEVLSTVSGGSIIGALYYLHARRLLESKEDGQITDLDYVSIVRDLERDFARATECNLRVRTFSSLRANLRMRRPDYSRSDRIAELYDEYIYRPQMPERTSMIEMRELLIRPGVLDPDRDNPARSAKVPVLLLNATVLNDGHMWRFEAIRMGESPGSAARREIDTNMVFTRPPTWRDMVERQRDLGLGHAVAASACFPAFPPMAVSGMYPFDLRVQLVDGGVHDNQGIEGLYDRTCTHLIVSDASGQMADDPRATGSTLGALLRESSIQGDRMREQALFALQGTASAVLHLRHGLTPTVVPYLRGDRTPADAVVLPPAAQDFGVDPRVQDLLSRVRTDLDAFSEIEACSLMLDGYLIAGAILPSRRGTDAGAPGVGDLVITPPAPEAEEWGFLRAAPLLARPSARVLRHLTVAQNRFLRAPMLVPAMWAVVGVLAACAAAILGLVAWALWGPVLSRHVTLGWVVLAAVLAPAVLLVPALIQRVRVLRPLRGPLDAAVRLTTWTVLAPAFWLVAQVELRLFDPVFRRAGRLAGVETDPAP